MVLGWEVFVKNRLRTAAFLSELQKQSSYHHFQLTDELTARMRTYTLLSGLAHDWFRTLTGQGNNDDMKKALYLGAITPVVDDLTDEVGLRHEDMLELLKSKSGSATNQIRLASYLYNQISKDPDEVVSRYLSEVIRAQDISLKQHQQDKLSYQELYDITFAKGGNGLLLYRSVLRRPIIVGEAEVLYQLGGIMQLVNDAFDVYKDRQAGVQTLFTNAQDIGHLENEFDGLVRLMCAKLLALDYPIENKRRTLYKILIIVSRGVVCIDQLMECQRRTDGKFIPEAYSRKELICDMEKVSNLMKSYQIGKALKRQLSF